MSDLQTKAHSSGAAQRHDKKASLLDPHAGARSVAHVFKSIATVAIILGGGAAYTYPRYIHEHLNTSTTQSVYLGAAIAVGTVVVASVFAFFGYVISLLVELNTRVDAPMPPQRPI